MKFRISRHSSSAPPVDAIDLLWARLGPRHEETVFAKIGNEIRATWGESRASSARDERAERGREEVLEIITTVCDRSPELKADWYAVSFISA